MNNQSYYQDKEGKTYQGAVTFEYYPFEDHEGRPKEQLVNLAETLIQTDSTNWGWLLSDHQYLAALPDVGLNHKVKKNPLLPSIA